MTNAILNEIIPLNDSNKDLSNLRFDNNTNAEKNNLTDIHVKNQIVSKFRSINGFGNGNNSDDGFGKKASVMVNIFNIVAFLSISEN